MRVSVGSTSGGQITTANDPVLVAEFHSRSKNAGSVVVGMSDVGTNNGRELAPGESVAFNFTLDDTGRSSGSVIASKFYTVASGGDLVDYTFIIRGD